MRRATEERVLSRKRPKESKDPKLSVEALKPDLSYLAITFHRRPIERHLPTIARLLLQVGQSDLQLILNDRTSIAQIVQPFVHDVLATGV